MRMVSNQSHAIGVWCWDRIAKENNVETIVISKEKNKVVQARCAKLSIECFNGIDEKLVILKNQFHKERVFL